MRRILRQVTPIIHFIGNEQDDSGRQDADPARNSANHWEISVLQRLVAQRRMIGWLGALGMVVGAILCAMDARQQGAIGGNLLRAGLVLGTLWLAIPVRWDPNAKKFTAWQGLSILMSVVVLVRRPWVIIPILLILGFIGLFKRRQT